jgi:hypothetical protein
VIFSPANVTVNSPKIGMLVRNETAGVIRTYHDRAFTSSLSCRTVSVALRISASPNAPAMVAAIDNRRVLSSR